MIPHHQPKYKIGDKFKLTLQVKHTTSEYETEVGVWCMVYGISVQHRHPYPTRYLYTVAVYRPHELPIVIGEYTEEALGENPPAL